MRKKEIIDFFLRVDYSLSPEHEEIFKSYLAKYIHLKEEEYVINRSGKHFTICGWSDNTRRSGSDTCICVRFERKTKKLLDIIQQYKNYDL